MLRIVTQNIWGKNDHWQQRADAIGANLRAQDVDVLCIQETSPDHFEYLRQSSFTHLPYAYYAPSDDGTVTPGQQGLAIFSRHAAQANGQSDLGREDHPQIDPWMRIIQWVRLAMPAGEAVTIFNTHLFLNAAQKQAGIQGCVEVMQQATFSDDTRILTGDFNILLNDPQQQTAPLTALGFRDVWQALHPDDAGYTWPLGVGRTPQRRLDGFFVHMDGLARVQAITHINEQPQSQPSLYLSDHIGVLGTFEISLG